MLSRFMLQDASNTLHTMHHLAYMPVSDDQQGQHLLLLEDHDFRMVDTPTYGAAAAAHAESQPSGDL